MNVKTTTLPNGLKLITVQVPGSPTTTVEVRVETGSKYETNKELGLSHFLEHMCFKGTSKRPSAREVNQALDELGAISNAFTLTEVTGYWAKAPSSQVMKILEIISDIYLNAIFKDEDVKIEQGVVTEEINMYEDKPESIAAELFDREIHGNQPAGLPIIGNKKSVNSFTANDLYAYKVKHYVPNATTVIVSGKFNEQLIIKSVKNLFSKAQKKRKEGKKATIIRYRDPRVVHKHKDTDQAHIILGLRSFPYKDSRNRLVNVIRGILSSGASSRLFHRLREELGICYYVYAHNSLSTDHGEFGVASGVDSKRIDVAVEAVIGELQKLKDEPVSEEELNKVKKSLVSKMYMSLETSENVADYFANRSMFLGDLKMPSQIEKEIMDIKPKAIQDMAKKLFHNKDLLLVVVSRGANKARLKKILTLK